MAMALPLLCLFFFCEGDFLYDRLFFSQWLCVGDVCWDRVGGFLDSFRFAGRLPGET